ncbi:MAG: hypothetical protein ACLUHA_17700 [Bacteroides stercoris]
MEPTPMAVGTVIETSSRCSVRSIHPLSVPRHLGQQADAFFDGRDKQRQLEITFIVRARCCGEQNRPR